jgi:hypothetical protein
MPTSDAVRDAFPAIEDIGGDDLRRGVIEAWTIALEENGDPAIGDLPWYPPIQTEIGLPDETLLEHVRGVVDGAVALADVLQASRGDAVLDKDLVLAGALVHDVSKPYEFDGMDPTSLYDAVGHPTYGVHVCAKAGLPEAVLHTHFQTT